jgi:hypothetical protein
MKPDVIVTIADKTTLFKTLNQRVSEWLRRHYHMTAENSSGDTEIRVHPTRSKQIVDHLQAAGFTVSTRSGENTSTGG